MIGLLLRALLWRSARLLLYALVGGLLLLCGCTLGTSAFLVTQPTILGAGVAMRTGAAPAGAGLGNAIVPVPVKPGAISDLERCQLAVAAGFTGTTFDDTPDNAILAVAVSIAEDPSGDPAALSSTDDIGLWQINLPTWGKQFDGAQALVVPQNNADAAFWIATHGGWSLWTTYRLGLYQRYIARAEAAAALASASVAPSTAAYMFPLPGWRRGINLHWGVAQGGSDLFAPRGQPIVSVGAGTVLEAGWDAVDGNSVLVKGDEGLQFYYAHFDQAPLVRVGQRVAPGTPLGVVGNTGDAAGGPTHLHIGIGDGIILGAGADGGTGAAFDAVTFLRQLYGAGS